MLGFLASRVLGVVRTVVVAAQFGDRPEYAAYLAANSVSDTVFQVLVGGAVGSAFIPVFKRYIATERDSDAWRVASSVINLGFLAAGGASIVLAVFARPLMDVLVAGQEAAFRDLAAGIARVLLVAPAIFAVSAFCASILNSFHRFAVAALAPLIYNLSIIGGALFLSDWLGIFGLVLGAVGGACLHFLIQAPALFRIGMRWRPILDLRHEGVREIGRLFAPRMLGLGAVQLNRMLSGILFASFFAAAAITYLDYAWQMIMTPMALAMAVGTAVFPTLSEESALARQTQFRQLFVMSLRMVLFLTIPASIGLMVLGEPVIRLVLERGAFTAESTRATAFVLSFYAIGLAGHATVEIVARAFYALHDTRTPVMTAVGAIALNITLSLILMQTPLGYGGLALANSLASLTEATVLIRLVGKKVPGLDRQALAYTALRVLAASLVMAWPVSWLAGELNPVLAPYGTAGGALLVVVCVAVGAGVYAGASYLFQSDELQTLRGLVRRR